MYGFLRPAKKHLNREDQAAYSRIYCGQCAALNEHFGYLSRILTSYDAAFFGLLIAAQRKESAEPDQKRCGLFPKKMNIFPVNDTVTRVSSALAVYFSAMKIKDRQQDSPSFLWSILGKGLGPLAKKAERILVSHGVNKSLASDTLKTQHEIEKRQAKEIVTFARPTEILLSTLLQSTAMISGKPENSEILARIGACLGRIIYLVDSCVDLSDDVAKREFNALLAVYATEGGSLRSETGDQVTNLIMQSLEEIRGLLHQLDLTRYQNIVENIFLVGLPKIIRSQLGRSTKRLKIFNPSLLKYAPHAALASALCLFDVQNAEAGASEQCEVGCTCGKEGDSPWFEICCNPCFYGCSWEKCSTADNDCARCCENVCGSLCNFFMVSIFILLQAPKAFLTVGLSLWLLNSSQKGNSSPQNSNPPGTDTQPKGKQPTQQQPIGKTYPANSTHLQNATREIKKYESDIKDKLTDLYGSISPGSSPPLITFDKKIQKVISEASQGQQNFSYSSSQALTEGLQKLTSGAGDVAQNVQEFCEKHKKLNERIHAIRQKGKLDDATENHLKFYEELISPSELTRHLKDFRFEEYHKIRQEIGPVCKSVRIRSS